MTEASLSVRRRLSVQTNEAAVSHGGFAAAKGFRERPLDLRKKDDKALMVWQEAIVSDLGGRQAMDMMQSSLLDRATELMIILRCMAEHCEQNGIIDKEGVLAPCLRTSFLSYGNSFRLTLQAIYERAGKTPGDKDLYEKWRSAFLKDVVDCSEGAKK
jgi:hypothetical protein